MARKGKRKVMPLSRGEVRRLVEACERPRDRALIAGLFLTGARISEFLRLRKSDLSVEELHGRKYLVVRLETLKNREVPYRNVPIPMSEPLLRPFLLYLREVGRGERLFPITRQRAWQILKEAASKAGLDPKRVWCHVMRHSRLTELGSYLGLVELTQFAGWSLPKDFGEARVYVHMAWRSYAPKMPRGERRV